jgi:CysZ protein
LLKEIVIAIESFFKAHRFIRKHRLWKWIIIPGFFYMVLFLAGMFLFWQSSNAVVSYITGTLGIDKWVHRQDSDILSFLFLMGEMMVRLILIFFYFSLFKYLFLIIGSPVFAYLSERTESIIEGRDFPFSFRQFINDVFRGVRLALRNTLWQSVFTISILILSFFPLVGWVTPVIMLFVECYYYGFSMLDYSCERHKLSPSESIEYITRHKGLAIGNGMMFFLMHLVPFAGWMLAPAYAVVAATLSMYHQKTEP